MKLFSSTHLNLYRTFPREYFLSLDISAGADVFHSQHPRGNVRFEQASLLFFLLQLYGMPAPSGHLREGYLRINFHLIGKG